MKLTLAAAEVLQIQLGAATTTNPVNATAQWVQSSALRTSHQQPTTTTLAAWVTAPATQSLTIDNIIICNTDTVPTKVTITRLTSVNALTITLCAVTLASGDILVIDDQGFRVLDNQGNTKTNAGH